MIFNFEERLPELPDPERALSNITTFLSENPACSDQLTRYMDSVAALFSYSQFLANYCIRNPDVMFDALNHVNMIFDTEQLRRELRVLLSRCASLHDGIKIIRTFKKDTLLVITLRDILKRSELQNIMFDLSALADAILSESLEFVESFLQQRYGMPENNSLSVIGLGKLGAEELNYSSDVDIIFVFRNEGQTSGIHTLQGVTINRITALEFYTKLVEEYTRFLSTNTEDGFAYRVDLRLRPQGQRGNLALPLKGYEEYYESWGQVWERSALLRARPVAGDKELGDRFLEMIQPFIYRKYLDFEAIDEIMRLKSQVEQIKPGTFSKDIKRGYGGIREIEFFTQIFQLIYGGKERLLQDRSTLKVLYGLFQKRIIGSDDYYHLSENYIFLRNLEHRLQQINDMQTHTLPSGDRDLDILGKKMGFPDRRSFLSELDKRRQNVRSLYDSLLESKKLLTEKPAGGLLSGIFWDIDTPIEHLLTEELSQKGFKNLRKAIHCLTKIRNSISSFQTIKSRRLLEDVLSRFVDSAVKGINPDLTLLQLVDFSEMLAMQESYLETISQKQEIISILTFVFSQSEYLSRILMTSPRYLDSLIEDGIIEKTLQTLKNDLGLLVYRSGEFTAIRLFRRLEEVRLGILFLNKKISMQRLTNCLTKVAEAVISNLIKMDSSITIIGYGKLGGREMTFNSDLDLVFLTQNETTEKDIKEAEKLLKVLMSYTKDGIAYEVDTRLRPEGSKGPLVRSLKGITDYYLKHAHPWELQALLKARPVAGNPSTSRNFMEMRKHVFMKRAREITGVTIQKMRERIQKELSKDVMNSGAYDIKLGAGGLEELEFTIQYLQLKNCITHASILVQGVINAIKRLHKTSIIQDCDTAMLRDTYEFYRTTETLLRLRNESIIKEGSASLQGIADFYNLDMDKFLSLLNEKRYFVSNFWKLIREAE